MDGDDEEVDDPGQRKLGAVGDDEELGDWDDEDDPPPSAQGRCDPPSGINRSAECDTHSCNYVVPCMRGGEEA